MLKALPHLSKSESRSFAIVDKNVSGDMMIELPQEKWTLGAVLAERARLTPDAPFVRMVGCAGVSFAQMREQSIRLARVLHRQDVKAGDRVVVMGSNCLTLLRCWFALNLLGATDVTINTAYRGRTLEHAVNTSGAGLILIEDKLLGVLAASEESLPGLQRALHFSASEEVSAIDARFRRLAIARLDEANAGEGEWIPDNVKPRDLASIIFTSGTSGPAKGVMIPHAQAYLLSKEGAACLQVTGQDIYYAFHPLFHMSPRYCVVYAALLAGAQVCLDRAFSAEQWLTRIRECGATVTIGHGPMLEMIFAQPERPDDAINPLRRLASSPFPKNIAARFERRFGIRGLEVWGMTEVNIPLMNRFDEPLRPGSCGKLLSDNYEFRIVDPETDIEVPTGTIGEFLVRSKLPWTMMQGYFGMPEATVEAWRNFWFHTGDGGYIDADGYVYFVDRLRDRIRRRAENVSSYDIECVAAEFPQVRECAAVGVPSEYSNDDDIKLVVAPKDGAVLNMEELLGFLAARLPHYMVPRYIQVVAELPRTPTNKVRKAALRDNGLGNVWDRREAGIALRNLIERQTDRKSGGGAQA